MQIVPIRFCHIGTKRSVLWPSKYAKIRFRPGLCPRPHRKSSQCSSKLIVGWGGNTLPIPHPTWHRPTFGARHASAQNSSQIYACNFTYSAHNTPRYNSTVSQCTNLLYVNSNTIRQCTADLLRFGHFNESGYFSNPQAFISVSGQDRTAHAYKLLFSEITVSGVNGGARGAPRVTASRGDTRVKKMWLNLQRTLDNTISEDGSFDEATAKKVITLQR